MPSADRLTPKQAEFVQQFLLDLNATAAARRAGYKGPHVDSIASRLVSKSHVREAIRTAQAERARCCGIKAAQVVSECAAIAFSNIFEMTADGPKLLPPERMSPMAARAVASVRVKRVNAGRAGGHETVEIKMHDKLAALRDLARHLDFLEESDAEPVIFKQINDVIAFARANSNGRKNGDG